MYYENYEDYMRSVLGYPISDQHYTYGTYQQYSRPTYDQFGYTSPKIDNTVELYPEIYRIVNPMVQKICKANTKPLSQELVDKMTEEIFKNLEDETQVVDIRVNLPKTNNIEKNKKDKVLGHETRNKTQEVSTSANRSDTLDSRNSLLHDLIKILILNQLLEDRKTVHSTFPRAISPLSPYSPYFRE